MCFHGWVKEAVDAIKPKQVLEVLRRIEGRGVIETTHRALETIRLVSKFAVAEGKAETNPANDIKGALIKPEEKHFPAITDPMRLWRITACWR